MKALLDKILPVLVIAGLIGLLLGVFAVCDYYNIDLSFLKHIGGS